MAGEGTDAFYLPDGDGFASTEWTRGPWNREHQHGGPPAALLGREIERVGGDPAMRIARLTLDLLRPIPITKLSVRAEVRAGGRNAQRIDAALEAGGEVLVRATALRLRCERVEVPTASPEELPAGPDDAQAFQFPFFTDPIGYHTAMEVRIAEGQWSRGPVAAWLRCRKALVAGERMSALGRVLVAADSGNGVSPILDPKRTSFVNPDLTVHLHRYPEGEWVCLDARTRVEPHGMGTSDARLVDERGPIGRGVQSLLVRTRE